MWHTLLALPVIDNRTMLVCQLMVTAVYAVTFFGLGRLHPNLRGIKAITLGFATGFVACLLLAMRGDIPTFLSVVVANALGFSAYALFYRGVLIFYGSPVKMLPVWCGIGIASVGLAIFSLGSDRIVARILICSVVLSLIRGLTAVELFRQAKGRPFVKGFAIWFASIAILSLNRVVLTPLFGAPSDFMRADIIQSSNLALSAIWVCMLGVFFLLMLCGELVAVVEAQTDRDSLSGCLNRRGIEKCLTYELKNMHRTHHKLSVALIDIDTFKEINDTRGHAAGDGVLRDLVSIVSEHLRPTDPFGRYGGDEFLLLLPRASREQAFIIAERLRQAVTTAFERDNRLAITLSVGIAEADSDEPLDSLLERADKALYEAKRTGRNRTRSLPYVPPAAHQLTDGRATLIASGLS